MLLDIILFAAVAAFLAFKLNKTLGERHEDEPQRPHPFSQQPSSPEADAPRAQGFKVADNVIDITPQSRPVVQPVGAPDSLAGRLSLIAQADPSFNEKGFLQGAKGAYELIVSSFAADDTPALRPLLSDDVYDSFVAAIRDRQSRGEKQTGKVQRILSADIVEAAMQLNTARVTVRFVSEQVQATHSSDGTVIAGSDTTPIEMRDVWTFSRNTRANDPNWHLAETRAEA